MGKQEKGESLKKFPMNLRLINQWYADGHLFARWSECSRKIIKTAKGTLQSEIKEALSRSCMHLKGHGGVKRAMRIIMSQSRKFEWVGRFDIASYYESIDHQILLGLLESVGASQSICDVVSDYLQHPDTKCSGKGMVAGGAISPLLGALYLLPLDRAMMKLETKGGVLYRRFMDDFIIHAKTKRKFRHAIVRMHKVLNSLKLRLHPVKRFIGRTEKGFDFLGYQVHPNRKLHPSAVSLQRLTERARRLYERGASIERLRQYVIRWHRWLHGNLGDLVTTKGGITRYWIYVLKRLDITGATIST
ncbi:MAG: reverse transcriptase domain-containing protein [Chlorobiaceae bacterium]